MAIEDPLRRAILDHDVERARNLVEERPELVSSVELDGSTVLDLALATGELSLALALVWNGATSQKWAPSNDLMHEYMGFISAGLLAGWLGEIEFQSYAELIGLPVPQTGDWSIGQQALSDLSRLARTYNGWTTVDRVFVPMDEWMVLFARWRRQQPW